MCVYVCVFIGATIASTSVIVISTLVSLKESKGKQIEKEYLRDFEPQEPKKDKSAACLPIELRSGGQIYGSLCIFIGRMKYLMN